MRCTSVEMQIFVWRLWARPEFALWPTAGASEFLPEHYSTIVACHPRHLECPSNKSGVVALPPVSIPASRLAR